jgi:DNA repair photolyase
MNPLASGDQPSRRGRGAPGNPANRFERFHYETDESCEPADTDSPLPTRLYPDDAQSIIAYNESPDVGFAASVNPYRGCEHGCIYCYARPTHEFLGCSAGLDFETKLFVKYRAAELLARELNAPGWRPQTLTMSGVTDCYQPVEARLKITRACLEVLAEFRNPVFMVTKSRLVTRDSDLLAELAGFGAAGVSVSITTLDPALARTMEPRASSPGARLEAISRLRAARVPVGVNFAPVIPGLNDHEAATVLSAAARAGAQFAGMTMVRLPLAVAPLFTDWLERHYPDRKEKVLSRIRSMRDGKLNSTRFGDRMRGHGPVAEQIRQLFNVSCRRAGLTHVYPDLSTAAFRRATRGQLELW